MATERYRASSQRAPQRKNPSTPGQSAKSSPRRPLSLEEKRRLERARREAIRREREEKARLAAIRRARRRRLFRLCFVISLVFVVLYWAWAFLSIATRSDGSEDALPLLLFTQGERKEDKRYEAGEVCVGGVKYLPVTELESYMAISQFGDHQTRSFLICASGEYATFYLGTEEAIVNGAHVSMRSPSFLKDDILYLPVEFFSDKMNCFAYGENNSTYGADVLTFSEEVEPGFIFASCPPDAAISYDTVPVAPTLPEETEDTTA